MKTMTAANVTYDYVPHPHPSKIRVFFWHYAIEAPDRGVRRIPGMSSGWVWHPVRGIQMSYSVNFLKWGYIGDYIGYYSRDYYRGY